MVTGFSSKTVSDICKHCFSKMLGTERSDSGVDKRRGSRDSECWPQVSKGQSMEGGLSFVKTELRVLSIL